MHVEALIVNETSAPSYGIMGPIFKHCLPHDTFGLRTANVYTAEEDGRIGWDAQCIAGNFNIFRQVKMFGSGIVHDLVGNMGC